MISIKELIHRLSRRIRDCARCLPSERKAKDFYLSALVHFTTPVRLRSDICSRNLFILFLVFMVCEIEERKKAEEHGVQPAKEQYRPSDDCSSSERHQFLLRLCNPSPFPNPPLPRPSPGEGASSDCKLVSGSRERRIVCPLLASDPLQHHPSALLHDPSNTVTPRSVVNKPRT